MNMTYSQKIQFFLSGASSLKIVQNYVNKIFTYTSCTEKQKKCHIHVLYGKTEKNANVTSWCDTVTVKYASKVIFGGMFVE